MRKSSISGPKKTTRRLANGEVKDYWYAYPGSPALPGQPGSAEFEAAHAAAVKERREAPTHGKLAGLAVAFKASPEFESLAPSTKAEWRRYIDLVQDERGALAIGGLPTAVLSDARVRQHLLAWRDQWRATPRKADYAAQVLCKILSWSVARGLIQTNVVLGHGALYKANRAAQIWTDEDIAKYVASASSPEVGFIVRLACLTGLRRSDLVALRWTDVSDIAIVITPLKSSRRRQPKKVVVPLLDDTLELLETIRAHQSERWQQLAAAATRKGRPAPFRPTTVLSTTRGRPWSPNGAEHQVNDSKRKAGVLKHLHDCRGTFATRLRLDGATYSEIADVLGWTEDRVERLLNIYVDNDAVVRAFAERLRAKSASRRSQTD